MEIETLKERIEINRKEYFLEKNITIQKIVDVFKNKNFQSSTIKPIAEEHNYSNGIFFEIYSISGEYAPTIDFIYFSKYTNQSKSLKEILSRSLLASKNKKIILIDEINKDGGTIDKKRIEKLFKKEFNDIEIYYLEEFASKKLYNDLIDEELFHQGSFGIKDFIQPLTNQSDIKTADLLLKEWYLDMHKPLVVLKGLGGIGKTTVVKYFLDDLYKKQQIDKEINILFINSHDLIHDIMKNPKIEDIFDFYKILAEKYQIKKRFDKKNLELSIDDGNVVMVLDGLDEVIAKVGSHFDISKFLNSIFTDYADNMGKAKIIITCRDYFWDKNTNFDRNIYTLMLKPFSRKMAKEYFKKHFEKESKVEKAIKLSDEFSVIDADTKTYIPYILDMIKEEILIDNNNVNIKTDILQPTNNVNDFLVSKVCEREIYKLDNLSIDEQINLFMDIALEYEGILTEVHLHKIEKQKNLNIEKFRAHPLLEYSHEHNRLKFRYDFFNEYFKNIKLSLFLNDGNFESVTENMIDIIIQHISYDGSLMKDLIRRLEYTDYENLKLKIYEYIKEKLLDEEKTLNQELRYRLNSSLFILLLVLSKSDNKNSRTELLREIYEEDSIVKNLCIINLHTLNSSKPIFNFENLQFEECHFENYEYFTECSFNENTFFKKCSFIAPLNRTGISPSLSYRNFDQTESGRCQLEGIIDILEEQKNNLSKKDLNLRKNLKQILKFFWQNSSFRQKQKDEVRKKLKRHNDIIEKLLGYKVLVEVSVVTKQKRNDKAYKIDAKYNNLRKIMEENSTCSEFEEIIQLFEN
jgi:hypothetical protein